MTPDKPSAEPEQRSETREYEVRGRIPILWVYFANEGSDSAPILDPARHGRSSGVLSLWDNKWRCPGPLPIRSLDPWQNGSKRFLFVILVTADSVASNAALGNDVVLFVQNDNARLPDLGFLQIRFREAHNREPVSRLAKVSGCAVQNDLF